jgi:hypothetical protein
MGVFLIQIVDFKDGNGKTIALLSLSILYAAFPTVIGRLEDQGL